MVFMIENQHLISLRNRNTGIAHSFEDIDKIPIGVELIFTEGPSKASLSQYLQTTQISVYLVE